ncbi:MAG: DNA translocase FtsK [Candidatus Omnitrophica bacterium]|nr:DNA translocase FtsK [Candidatus Omnitrophota bacterium]
MKEEHINEIKGIIVFAFGIIFLVSLLSFVPEDLPWYTSSPNIPAKNLIRITGAYAAGSLFFAFGYSAYALVAFLFFLSWNKFASRELKFTFAKFFCFLILFCVLSSLFSMTGPRESIMRFHRGGITGIMISDFLVHYIGMIGAYVILIMFGMTALILTGEFLVSPLFMGLVEKTRETVSVLHEKMQMRRETAVTRPGISLRETPKVSLKETLKAKTVRTEEEGGQRGHEEKEEAEEAAEEGSPDSERKPSKPIIRMTTPDKKEIDDEKIEPQIIGEYHLPMLDLLQDPPRISTEKIQNSLINEAQLLEATLAEFGVSVRVADIERGPAITRYELEPAPGVKVQRITTLSDDIALAMRAATVRIVAPIPGKNRVGIEVPNTDSAFVYLKDVLSTSQFRSSASKLTLSLGKDIAGKPMIADLAEMPHLLIAGTTGSGKTVCVNGIIMSMLLNASPNEVKFVMIDPKMVELAQYNDIPHLLCPVVTDTKKASGALNWIVGEMESRYRKLSKTGVRNVKAYNAKGLYMPYIVLIIDELADLMQVSAKTVESAITRIAQLSRAVGIHLILATQRPSVDVITGVIKANFPARISFKVASKVDSRTVLDMNGAETLLGKGDMLFIRPGEAKPTRGQCSFVKDEEINKVIRFIKDQQAPSYDESITTAQQKGGTLGGADQYDEYYDEAVKLVIETNQASVSILQRRMRLGYTRAARLIDMMEQNGIVGPYCGSKPREILVDREQWLLDNAQGNGEDHE